MIAGVQPQLAANLPRIPLPKASATAVRADINNNRTAAGALRNGVLTLSMEVVESAWRPEGDNEPEVPILAFRVTGKMPTVPGPLVRVPQGTEIRLTLSNKSDSSLVIGGLRPQAAKGTDTIQLAARSMREIRYKLDKPGTYWYWGAFKGTSWDDRLWLDSQLNGAIVVDPPGGSKPDHILMITEWFHPYRDRPFEVVSLINGKGWPHTERLTLRQGDSTHFRVINTLALQHPMHLHGFYYKIKAKGTSGEDIPIAPELQPVANTDLLLEGSTMTLSFVPTTPGNWIFHCHFAMHVDSHSSLAGSPKDSLAAPAMAGHQHGGPGEEAEMQDHMRGLVVGLHVEPAAGYVAQSFANARTIRLLVQKQTNRLIGNSTAYGFVVQNGDTIPKKDSVRLPGPVLELERGKPVRINVVNNLEEPTGVHWHGLEIESFPDGVPNWSGMKGGRIMPPIKAGDSLMVEFNPPRSGTFLYHSHLNELHQIESGMYGAIVVSDKPRDPATDLIVIAGGGGPVVFKHAESPFALVNGRRSPRPLRMIAGEKYRLRLVSIHPEWRMTMTLRNDSTIARWRAIAKDGADLPLVQATWRPSHIVMGPGETADFEFTPSAAGEWLMEVKSAEAGWYVPLPVIVSEPAPKVAER